ncbi:dipeptide transport ATP-binding protein DppF [Cutibacterium acnes JCM 18918]|nr:dipeptide transport ATP-binding protein DppF [Cutibacterium acnes JCM 18918]
MEIGEANKVVDHPRHPYTRALIEAIPVADPAHHVEEIVRLQGEPASAIDTPPGCRFKKIDAHLPPTSAPKNPR